MFICDVLAVTVRLARFVSVVPNEIPVDATIVVVPEPKFMVLEFPLSDVMALQDKLYVERLKDPFVTVILLEPMSKALPNVHPQSTPFIVILPANATPFVVNVRPVELLDSVIAPVYVLVSPVAGSVTLP